MISCNPGLTAGVINIPGKVSCPGRLELVFRQPSVSSFIKKEIKFLKPHTEIEIERCPYNLMIFKEK